MKKDTRSTWRVKASAARAAKSAANQADKALRHRKKLLNKMAWEKAKMAKIIEEKTLEATDET